MSPIAQPPLPSFEVRLRAPDIRRWLDGNTGIRGFTSRDSGVGGPHVGLLALTHGNEIAGAIVLERLLQLGLAPKRGRLTFGFVHLAAYERFDPRQPTASRFIDEDLNRLWDPVVLNSARRSTELERAREIRPLIDKLDVLFDLHSMLWASEPLILCGTSSKGKRLALGAGTPPLVVADRGHASGRRMIDYARFADEASPCAAVLLEAGQHWQQATVDTMLASVAGLLRHLDLIRPHPALPTPQRQQQRYAEVTMAVTATTSSFSFVQPYRGGDVIPRRNTLIAIDGETEIRTPLDDCLLIMPSLRPSRGHTAVRLARFVET
ncbi:MAG TPA: succinylglutamate desuccinylase/aspartoacylase family protein [Acetobacteraceae bacterium]|jgi:predicted deacylase|nr:succinylglutamate desuccinylase/aspartoacylase family protein [Acetobacteraceae bacterium]